ncbi:MAG: phenylacetate--CoA ligase family protein [Gemmatimonadaceae bacterium]
MSESLTAWPQAVSSVIAFRRHPGAARSVLTEFQNRRVRRIVEHAYNRVPYYRRLLDGAGVHPRHIATVADLQLIPITTKSDIKHLPLSDLLAESTDPATLIEHSTGGSTGEPFTVRRSWMEERVLGELRRRTLRLYGANSGALVVVATFHHRPHRNDNRFLELVLNAFGRYRVRSIFCLESPESLLRQFREMAPDVIGGYAGVLSRLAHVIAESGVKTHRPRFILSGGEVLSASAAKRISAAFGAPIYDTYGSHEFSRIAWECPATGDYHRCDDGVVTEVLRNDQPVAEGEEGEIVGTALHSYSMPFIRYRLGDVATQGQDSCLCGQPFSTLGKIQGRVVDYFTMPDGTLLHPYQLAAALKDKGLHWVAQYQLIQESATSIVLKAVRLIPPSEEDIAEMKRSVETVIGNSVSFDIELVDRLELEDRGKFRVYRSLVPNVTANV